MLVRCRRQESHGRISGAVTIALLLTGAATLPAARAYAAETAPADDIIVTAQRRAESVQDIPLSISALTGAALEARGISDFRGYAAQVPNLAFGYTQSLGGTAQTVTIRGVFGQNTTGFYLDDSPLPGSIDPRVLDFERIEVLRGPQGTLYGARSMGGTVRLITRAPDMNAIEGSALGRLSTTANGGANGSLDGVVNIPLVAGKVAVRASGYYESLSGIYDRVAAANAPAPFRTARNVDSSHRFGGALVLAADFGALTVTPRYMFQRATTDGRALADINAGNFTQPRLFDLPEPGSDDWDLGTLTIGYDTGAGDITLATTLFGRTVHESEDFSEVAQLLFGTPAIPAIMRARSRVESRAQEIRYASDFEGWVNVTAGLFYQKSDNRLVFPPTPLPGVVPDVYSQDFRTRTTEYAAFGEFTFRPADNLRLIAGARLFDSEVRFAGSQDGVAVFPASFSGRQKENGINPRFAAQFDAADDVMLYASAAKGYRVGGVNAFSASLCEASLGAVGLTPDDVRSYGSDSLWSYEVGAKTRSLNRRLTLNGALFRIDWSNVQQGMSLACGFGVLVNGGKARSDGGEIEGIFAATDWLKLNFGAGYTNARITDGGGNPAFPDGARIQQVPRWTANAGFDIEADPGIPLTLHGDWSYTGQSYSRSNVPATRRNRPAYNLVNLRATAHLDRVDIGLFADNLFNEAANLSDIPSLAIELPGRPRIVATRPRTLGVEARVRF
ncbi:TonB-dependent receptor [Sandaracinobacter sp. RS1-74]|uniref:TonB-dependent receptor n=1 Tax=Sandaracinobacteroides sayramensis TaxID=2913411 RepID=UPI001EDB89D2|nr:TonB-dependent receptor [Sandaracinobacteroides sayramensis]MCG2840639.1 TonB-dependent receptor [Sandaracinobacteroides sayramensis]